MDYLFFDIECSDGRSICSFGYVLTDDNFNVIKKEDIIINPESYFHTGAWGKKNREKYPGIELAYPEAQFKAAPPFPHFYEIIKKVITAENRRVLGFSHTNDAKFLSIACERYSLPSIDYKFYDVQSMYREYKGELQQSSLEKLIAEFGIDISGAIPHKSDDDAEVSMLFTKKFSETLGVDLEELIEMYPYSSGIHKNNNTVLNKKPKPKNAIPPSNKFKGRNRIKFFKFQRIVKPSVKEEKTLDGLAFMLAADYERSHFREVVVITQLLANKGARYTMKAQAADKFVLYKSDGNEKSTRYQFVRKAIEEGKPIDIISFSEFTNLLGVQESELSTLPLPEAYTERLN